MNQTKYAKISYKVCLYYLALISEKGAHEKSYWSTKRITTLEHNKYIYIQGHVNGT